MHKLILPKSCTVQCLRCLVVVWDFLLAPAEIKDCCRFTVNRVPTPGACLVVPDVGVAAETLFTVQLTTEFQDEDLPFRYEVSIMCEGETTFSPMYSGNSATRNAGNTLIPKKQTTNNVTCQVKVKAMDTIGSYTDIRCSVTVSNLCSNSSLPVESQEVKV